MKKNEPSSSVADLSCRDASRRSFLAGLGAATVATAVLRLAISPAQAALPDAPRDLSNWHALVDRWIDDNGLIHNGCNQAWAYQCELLPCFYGVSFPGYSERIIRGTFEGNDVVIHLWKGWCNKFPFTEIKTFAPIPGVGLAPQRTEDFPGGAGAEVGIYRVRSDKWIADSQAKRALDISRFNLWFGAGYIPLIATGGIRKGDQKWYPAPELKAHISFQLRDPRNPKNVMIDTTRRYDYIKRSSAQRPEDYYWCTEWLEKDSYEKWVKARPQYDPKTGKILDSVGLTLDWQIVGKKGGSLSGTWTYQDGDENCAILVGCRNK